MHVCACVACCFLPWGFDIILTMPVNYIVRTELTEEERILAECAKAASRDAVRAAFAAGLSITIAKGDKIVQVAPDGTETIIGDL